MTTQASAPPAAVAGQVGIASRTKVATYLSIALMAGALIVLQVAIMRIFAVGNWAPFGGLVVSLAMLGFGLTSAVLCVVRPLAERHLVRLAEVALIAFGPLLIGANLCAQQLPFDAVFMLANPRHKWLLLANFVLYLLPVLAGSLFLGIAFIVNRRDFGRIYFADLSGAGVCGGLLLLSMYVVAPEHLILVPLALGVAGGGLWLLAEGRHRGCCGLAATAALAAAIHCGLPTLLHIPVLALSEFKGIAYARKLPDSNRLYRDVSPFGDLQIYASSYLHFAPGLSDNAAFNLPTLPKDSYLGLYIDGDGPVGIIRDLPAKDRAYFTYLPMIYPYLIKQTPETLIVRFGGGISTVLALSQRAKSVTVAESNPAILRAFSDVPIIKSLVGDTLHAPNVEVVEREARLYLAATPRQFDIIDLSLTNSTGLSSAGGFPIVERFDYTQEAMRRYLLSLKPGGILAVTLWNKEEPPKSVLKLYATMVAAAGEVDAVALGDSFFVFANYLSTATVLYKRGGFSADEIARLRRHTESMSFDEIYYPKAKASAEPADALLEAYRIHIFGPPLPARLAESVAAPAAAPGGSPSPPTLPATRMGRYMWEHLIRGDWPEIAGRYVFDVRPLTDDRPYFAGYVKPRDLPQMLDRLEVLQDEWGYLLLWATLGVAFLGAALLLALPIVFGWRAMLATGAAMVPAIAYFACLGLGYIVVEVALLAKFVLPLGNYTLSAAVVITGMLLFSGIGSLLSGRCQDASRTILPRLLLAIGFLLMSYALWIDPVLGWIGSLPAVLPAACCLVLLAPAALLMGFPMPLVMTALARQGEDRMFIWAWGINGCFSVIGASLVPIIGTAFGLNSALAVGAGMYLIAVPAAVAVLQPLPKAARQPA